MAKFKKGDGAYIKKTGDFCKIISEMPKQAGRFVYKVKILVGPSRGEEVGLFEEDLISEGEHQRSIGNSRACNSTNPVVANAMRARNATYQYHDYDVPVIQLGQRKYITIMGVADEETAKAIVRSKPGITIDESRKVKVKNASA